jgi:hypothetical protein
MGLTDDPYINGVYVQKFRDRAFVARVQAYGLPTTPEEERRLIDEVWPALGNMRPSSISKKVQKKLKQPDIREAIKAAFEVCGFTPTDAIQMHIKHIRGYDTTTTTTDAEGNESTSVTQQKPSYQALKDYEQIVIDGMNPAKTVKVESRSVSMQFSQPTPRLGPPPTRARALSSSPAMKRVNTKAEVIADDDE